MLQSDSIKDAEGKSSIKTNRKRCLKMSGDSKQVGNDQFSILFRLSAPRKIIRACDSLIYCN